MNNHRHPKIPFTKEGLDKVRARYDLLTQRRPDVLERLQKAREMGDLSENGAYQAARFELGSLDRELKKLTYLVRLGRVKDDKSIDVAHFGSKVTVKLDDKEISFRLVTKHESDLNSGKLSDSSPLGRAVMGKKRGDQSTMQTPNGSKKVTILKVE